ncbi:MAG: class I SAM-dependent methyltransferase [Planctomycetes bacterium]|nr:class I SAM-dependent methyltransferase [Planctomycetota bacterium]
MFIANTISAANRKRKYEQFIRSFQPGPETTILDVGYSNKEYSNNENYLERHYPHLHNITALGVVPPGEFARRYPSVRTVQYDGKFFPFGDKQFDIIWSNAVWEHVGPHDRQLLFLNEIKRVARRAYITTPNRYFPFEVHTKLPFFHYLPRRQFDRILRALRKEWAAGDFMFLMSLGDVKRLLAEAGIDKYRIHKIASAVLPWILPLK